MQTEIVSLVVGAFSPYFIELLKWVGKKFTNEVWSGRIAFILTLVASFALSFIALILEGKVSISIESIIQNWGLVFAGSQIVFKMLDGTRALPRVN